MNDFNQDMQNLLNAYDSNWDDYLALRKQFIEKYKLSVEKLQERCDRYKKALTEIASTRQEIWRGGTLVGFEATEDAKIAHDALAAIENEGSGDE